MSQMLPRSCPWFSVPQHVVRQHQWAKLKPGEAKLYIALLHECEKRSNREVRRKDDEMSVISGASPRTLRDARIKLQEYGLIRYRLDPKGYVYTICDPANGQPFSEVTTDKASPRNQSGTSTFVSDARSGSSNAGSGTAEKTVSPAHPGGIHLDFSK